jgi:predicted peptidase
MRKRSSEVLRHLILVLAVGAISAVPARAQAVETGFLNRSVAIDGAEYRYQVYLPREYITSRSWPVILALHGGGQYGRDGILQTDVGLAAAIRRHPDRFPAVIVFPQSPPGGTAGFQGLGERIALAALDRSAAEFHGDRSRTYLTGLSMGGNGAWSLAFRHPERFAALLVVCGFVETFTGTTSGVHYPPIVADGRDPFATIAKQVSRMPVWIFHGEADATVPVAISRRMAAALEAIGADVQYTELPGIGHNAWDNAYDRAEVFTWLFRQRRR